MVGALTLRDIIQARRVGLRFKMEAEVVRSLRLNMSRKESSVVDLIKTVEAKSQELHEMQRLILSAPRLKRKQLKERSAAVDTEHDRLRLELQKAKEELQEATTAAESHEAAMLKEETDDEREKECEKREVFYDEENEARIRVRVRVRRAKF